MKSKIFIAIAGIALLAACKGRNGNYEIANNSRNADTVGVSSASDTVADVKPKLVKTADMSFKVKNVQQTGDSISHITAKLNGLVIHHQMGSSIERSEDIRLSNDSVMRVSAFNTTADMTVKIPSEKLEDFMNHVSHMGIYVTARKMDIEDKSLDYLSAKLKLKNRREWLPNKKQARLKLRIRRLCYG
jgi:(p)ppGpp synthase/HD superfamily hydrolase